MTLILDVAYFNLLYLILYIFPYFSAFIYLLFYRAILKTMYECTLIIIIIIIIIIIVYTC